MPAANHRQLARQVMNAALKAVDPARAVTDYFQANPQLVAQINDSPGRVLVVGAGKAGAPMAAAVSEIFGNKIEVGRVVVKYGHSAVGSDKPDSTRVEISEAGHPVPDRAGLEAARAIVQLLNNSSPQDIVLCLISGGGSALLTLPANGLSLGDLQATTESLLAAGATIKPDDAAGRLTIIGSEEQIQQVLDLGLLR